MFISQLKDRINAYDRYHENRTNGLKALYVTELLFVINFFFNIDNPYFYFFYVPLTAFTAELLGRTIEEKFLFLTVTTVGSAFSVFLFGLFSIHKTLFPFFALFFSASVYYFILYRFKHMLALAPLILSLAVYSLIYPNQNSNAHIAFRHFLETIAALLVIIAGLLVFPKSYYLKIWKHAFDEVITNLGLFSEQIVSGDMKTIPIFNGIIVMERYCKMLPRHIKYYSVLKITVLAFELIMALSYIVTFQSEIKSPYIKVFRNYLLVLKNASKNNQKVHMDKHDLAVFNETPELKILYQLILSWNYLCSDL